MLEDFYRICDSIEPDEYGCLPYPGASHGFYFKVHIRGVGVGQIKINRLVLERKLGRPMHPGFLALHTCDLKNCVNQGHLYEGTYVDNMRDRALRDPESLKGTKGKYQNDLEYRAKMQINLSKAPRRLMHALRVAERIMED